MYRLYVVRLHVHEGVELKLLPIRGGFMVSLGCYVCNVITLIYRIMREVCYSALYCRTVPWYKSSWKAISAVCQRESTGK